jgi:hypothetical protein
MQSSSSKPSSVQSSVQSTSSNPSSAQSTSSNPSLANPSLANPSLANPSLANPSLENPSLANPSLANLSSSNPFEASSTDITTSPSITTTTPQLTLPPISTTTVNITTTSTGPKSNNIIYFNNLTCIKNKTGGTDVSINSPLLISHYLGIPGSSGDYIYISIDTNWNISAKFNFDGNRMNRSVYGTLTITTNLQNGNNITSYKTKCCNTDWESCGSYNCMAQQDDSNTDGSVSILQTNDKRTLTFSDITNLFIINLYAFRAYTNYGTPKQIGEAFQISDKLAFGQTNSSVSA